MFSGLVPTAFAATSNIDTLLAKVKTVIINPAIGFIFALALAVFLFGVVEFLFKKDSESGRAEGKRHMLWGIVGMAIMLGAFGIVNLIINSLG